MEVSYFYKGKDEKCCFKRVDVGVDDIGEFEEVMLRLNIIMYKIIL